VLAHFPRLLMCVTRSTAPRSDRSGRITAPETLAQGRVITSLLTGSSESGTRLPAPVKARRTLYRAREWLGQRSEMSPDDAA